VFVLEKHGRDANPEPIWVVIQFEGVPRRFHLKSIFGFRLEVESALTSIGFGGDVTCADEAQNKSRNGFIGDIL
jgi:hypothetical protein